MPIPESLLRPIRKPKAAADPDRWFTPLGACAATSQRVPMDQFDNYASKLRQVFGETRRLDAAMPAKLTTRVVNSTPTTTPAISAQTMKLHEYDAILGKSASARAAYPDAASMSAALNRKPTLARFDSTTFAKGTPR